MLKISVLGASGRMGQAVLKYVVEAKDLELVGALTELSDSALGRDAGDSAGLGSLGVELSDNRVQVLEEADVAIDFTLPTATQANLSACVECGTALVVGTTGLEEKDFQSMREAARQIPLVYGRNMSIGVNVFMDLVGRAAKALGEEYDVEILDAHHRQKVDAPSGTALALGEEVAKAKGRTLEELGVQIRVGQTGPRKPDSVGFSVIRAGNIVGDHSVLFAAPEERIELVHRAADRKTFARGALRAAMWLRGKSPGFYTMRDVLGL